MSTSARAATRAGLLAEPPSFFGRVDLTDAGRAELPDDGDEDEGEAHGAAGH
ncbi:hypothetical protein [Frankia sp. CcI49]|uniref:hypothetical protein n=1 Tax=Frankia sp. CcI49 TaxID=1745382 RepID=UPI0013040FFB|nr:hypothetical protein [Frankia sp. CcI49]